MNKIESFGTIEGRRYIHKLFYQMRYEKQRSSISTLISLWKICTIETNINKYIESDYTILHPLGYLTGTALWMEEVVNRFYYSTINSFVYFGAAILLILVGLRRFTSLVEEPLVVAGIMFEAFLLIFMFVVMIFSPSDEVSYESDEEENQEKELIREIGEIGRDFASVAVSFEKMIDKFDSYNENQEKIYNQMNLISEKLGDLTRPNPEILQSIKSSSESFYDLKINIDKLTKSLNQIQNEEISFQIRKMMEEILKGKN